MDSLKNKMEKNVDLEAGGGYPCGLITCIHSVFPSVPLKNIKCLDSWLFYVACKISTVRRYYITLYQLYHNIGISNATKSQLGWFIPGGTNDPIHNTTLTTHMVHTTCEAN